MNAADAKNLTLVPEMILRHVRPRYEFWTGGILYNFVPCLQMEQMVNNIMRDPGVLCVWIDANGNGIVSTKFAISS